MSSNSTMMIPPVTPNTDITTIGIVGEGKMGTGIFYYLLDFDYQLVWACSKDADIEKISRQFNKKIMRSFDAGILDRTQVETRQKSIITSDLSLLHDCDLIIEAVPEVLEVKQALFEQLDKIVNPGAIFASNTSSIAPSVMAPAGRRAERFAGLHFFYPVALKNIVEFTTHATSSPEMIAAVESFLERINRRFITLDEDHGFLLNRIFLDVQNEAFRLVSAGHCTYRQMDQLVKKHLFLFGIFDFIDSVGLDTMLASIRNYTHDYPHRSYYEPFISVLAEKVGQGRLGVKTREGFYHYPLDDDVIEEPSNKPEIIAHLRQTWLSSAKRFTAQAHLPIDDANHAIREYFDLDKGPFE